MTESVKDLNLTPEDLDALAETLLTLTQELWVVKDRVRVLEAALEEQGSLQPGSVDQLEPGEQLAAVLGEERRALLARVLAALNTKA